MRRLLLHSVALPYGVLLLVLLVSVQGRKAKVPEIDDESPVKDVPIMDDEVGGSASAGRSQEIIEEPNGESQEVISDTEGRHQDLEDGGVTTMDPRLSTAKLPSAPYPLVINEFTCLEKNVEECRTLCKPKLPDDKRDEVLRCLEMASTLIKNLKTCVNGKALPDPHECVWFRFTNSKPQQEDNGHNCGANVTPNPDYVPDSDSQEKKTAYNDGCNTETVRKPTIYDDLEAYFICERDCKLNQKQYQCDYGCKEPDSEEQATLDSCAQEQQEKTGLGPFKCLKDAMGGRTRGHGGRGGSSTRRGRRSVRSSQIPSWLKFQPFY